MKKLIQYFAIIPLFSILFLSCKKETPVTIDAVAPKVTFRIQGNGNDNSFESTGLDGSPIGEYIFKPNTRYTFTVSITDTSGLGQLIFKMTKGDAVAAFTLNGAPVAEEVPNAAEYQYTISTLGSDPYQSFLMTGDFLTGNAGAGPDIRFSIVGRDFRPNRTNLNLNGSLHENSPSGIFGWNEF